ncbi:MAG TPA: glycoside hydrolase family 3 N-terminal domain-containing protein [Steroidobacteraceae bacterium]|jgi:beta-glucosidase|nr:glycoside hydrolase family 3 N-terminal domain-containing protein [Steroidobacteraceae bacterium]
MISLSSKSGRRALALAAAALTLASLAVAADTPLYKDPHATVDARVNDLLARMTLQEKIAQLSCIWQRKGEVEDANGDFDPAKAGRVFPYGIGQVARPSDRVPLEANDPLQNVFRDVPQTVAFVNAVQHYSVEDTRLGIPTLFHGEGLHGYMARDATSFPQAIALASSWDPALITSVYTVVAREARARGVQLLLTPVINLGRDPRWGRIEETFGEDPYIAARMGVAEVRGLQGDTLPLGPDRVFATLKHMAAYGVPEAGTNVGPVELSQRTLLQMYLPQFHAAIQQAGAQVVMASYNEIGGIPSHANRWMLTDVLRGQWGFQGVVVADYEGIEQLMSLHHVAGNLTEAAARALHAGVDDDMPDGEAFANLSQALAEGKVSQGEIDTAVRRVLRLKFLGGLFEHPYADARHAEKITDDAAARAVAVKAAQESIILLKNDGALPLDTRRIRTLAVIGPNAAVAQLGGYSEVPAHSVSILQGIRNLAGHGVRVVYAPGVKLVAKGDQYTDQVVLPPPAENRALIRRAVSVARTADEIVLAIGTRDALCREGWADNHLGDRDSLQLIDQQQELADAMFALGKPVVVVLINGCPLAVDEIAHKANALIEGWYLGQEGGTAMADVLYGRTNPGGKLTVTIPRAVGFVPYNYDEKPSAHRGYQFANNSPLFPFGYGLSYTTFQVGPPVLSAASIPADGKVTVSVSVRNTGKVAGDEVVQLYLHELVTSVTEPTQALRGFKRVSLAPGAATQVRFELGRDDFAIWDENMKHVVEPGTFQVMAGPDSVDLKTATFEVTR